MKVSGNQILFALLAIVLMVAEWSLGANTVYKRELTHRTYTEHYPPVNAAATDSTIHYMRIAAREGYNAVLFDGPFEVDAIETWKKPALDGYARVRAEAKRLNMATVSMNFAQVLGAYTNPNLGEVAPVRNTPFKVTGKEARCQSDHSVGLKNGGFETFNGNNPTGWMVRNLSGSLVRDAATKHSGSSSLRATNIKANAHIYQKIKVKPYRAYRITAWFRTLKLSTIRDVEFVVRGKETLLDRRWRPFGSLGKWTTFSTNMPNWTKSTADFVSHNNGEVEIAFWFATAGYAAGAHPGGAIWIDDMKVEEVGLYETMRRNDCPIVVKSADGSRIYKEGTDYVVDPKCDTFTKASCYYEGHLKIPAGSSIQNGQTLAVSWYKFADNYILHAETNFCILETWEAMRDNVTRIDDLMGHSKWSFLNYDEWRGAFQSDRCPLFPWAKTAGEYMAATLAKTVKTNRCINNAKREIWLYNDMFDPYHNGNNPYHMSMGGTLDSWKGMDTSIVILNWRSHPASYGFFMGVDEKRKGIVNKQIILCQSGGEVAKKVEWIKDLESKGGRGVIGMNWITWYWQYQHLVSTARAWKALGWWGTGPLPDPGFKVPEKCDISHVKTASSHKPASGASLAFVNGSETCGIKYSLPYHSQVDLKMVDALGRTIKTLVSKEKAMGTHQIRLKTSGIPVGVYFFMLNVNGSVAKQVRHVVM